MAVSQDDLDALEEAMSSGEKSVKVDGREIEYRSIAEMKASHRFIAAQLNQQKGRRPRRALSGIASRVNRGL